MLRLPADGSKHQGHDPPSGANDIEGEVGGILFLGHLHHCARAPWHDIMTFVMKVPAQTSHAWQQGASMHVGGV